MKSKLRFVVTGCGRSGTGYLAHILQEAGIRGGHEQYFGVHGPKKTADTEFDASWFAAPYLSTLDKSCKIIHLVRNPHKVVASFHRIGLCADSPWRHFGFGRPILNVLWHNKFHVNKYLDRRSYILGHRKLLIDHTACWKRDNEVDRLWAYWNEWNALVEKKAFQNGLPYLRIRLEDVDFNLEEIAAFLNLPTKLQAARPQNLKTNYSSRKIAWTMPPEKLLIQAERYGYSRRDVQGY